VTVPWANDGNQCRSDGAGLPWKLALRKVPFTVVEGVRSKAFPCFQTSAGAEPAHPPMLSHLCMCEAM